MFPELERDATAPSTEPAVLPGMLSPTAKPKEDDLSRFEGEGGKPAQTQAEREERERAERKARMSQRVETVKSTAAAAQDAAEQLVERIRLRPVSSAAAALAVGWLLGRIWPR